jgi:hypothetical protein
LTLIVWADAEFSLINNRPIMAVET